MTSDPRRHLHPLRDQRTGGDDRSGADVRAVQKNGAHADETAVLDGAAMNDGRVPNRHVVADRGGMGVFHHVDDGAVLHVRTVPDANPVHVAADDRHHPHAAVFANLHVADDLSAIVDEGGGMNQREPSPMRPKHSKDYSWDASEGGSGWTRRQASRALPCPPDLPLPCLPDRRLVRRPRARHRAGATLERHQVVANRQDLGLGAAAHVRV